MTTSLLTRILQMATDEHQPPMIGGRRIKLKYAHPGGYNPPIIVVHGNQMDKLPDSYKRYLSNYYRKSLKIIGSPIRLLFQEGSNPFAGRKNKLTPNQLRKRKRLMKFIKKRNANLNKQRAVKITVNFDRSFLLKNKLFVYNNFTNIA